MTIHPDYPRYEVRQLPAAEQSAGFLWGLFDTVTQSFVVGGGHFKLRKAAEEQARRYNNAYARKMER